MKIESNKIAILSYKLTLADGGELVENVTVEKPVSFQFGVNQLLPVFEKNLGGKKAGDDFDFIIPAAEAYGLPDPYAVFDIPKETFEVDGKTDDKMLQIGNVIPMTDDKGNKHMGKVTKVLPDAVTLDFNHPLAGKDLHFVGKVIEVKESETN